ncbi:MAG TPA: serine/threonine-protein kinase [Gemmataceae bacterium]|nr:serine/threonine-protein kinase [Gemmataceae bacterium]
MCRVAAPSSAATVVTRRAAAPPTRQPDPARPPVPAGDAAATRSPFGGTDRDDYFPDPREYLPEAPPGYDLLCQLGAGGVGTVYLAREHATERTVAMKFLNCPTSPTAFERFLVEARALARLDHPNIVKVIAVETNWREPYLTMEYAAGGTLADLAPPSPAEAARLVLGAAEAVTAAHAADILHRDIKPSNILLQKAGGSEAPDAGPDATPSGSDGFIPKVSDFGLAKRTDRDDGLTRTGPLGTPSYMSPEAAAGRHRDIGPAADVYGLGATLYHLLTGHAPFVGEARDEILRKVLREPPVRPRAVRPDVPADLEAVAIKCLEKDPAARYPTATALAADLRRFLAGQVPDAPVLSPARRARRWVGRQRNWIAAGVAAVVLAAGLVAAGILLRPGPADPEDVIRREIAAGKKARLLRPDGQPRAANWPLGPEYVGPDDGGICSFGSPDLRILVLLTDPGVDSYRFEADIYQAQKLGDVVLRNNRDHNQVGLALGYAGQDGANQTRVHSFMVLAFTDHDPGDGPKVRRWFELIDCGIVGPPGLAPGGALTVRGVPAARLPPPGPQWRTVAVEVTPDGIKVPGPNGQPQLADAAGIATRRNGPREAGCLREYVAPTAGPVELPDWSPRMPLGIWCKGSWVYVRNVTIKKL